MGNTALKQEMREAKVRQWQIADELGVCEMTLVRWLRHELPPDKKAHIRSIIAKLKEGAPMIKKLTGLSMGCKELAVSIMKAVGLLAVLYGTYWIGMFALNYVAAMMGGTGA